MNLNQLRVFCAVANRLSFTLAGEDLHLTQPAVSLQVKALERSVRIRLFERRGNVLSLTEAGRVLYDSAVAMLNAEDQAKRDLAELAGGRRGTLTVGANTTGGMYLVPELISAFREQWPEAEVVLHIEPAVRIFERIHQNVIDVGFVGGPIEDQRFRVEHLALDPLVLIFSPRHRFAGRASVSLEELAGQPFVVPESTSLARILFERALRQAGVTIRIGHQLHETEPVKKAVEANLGVGIVSAHAITREVAGGHLATAGIEGLSMQRYLEMVTRPDKYFSPLALRFQQFAREFFK
ncbi:MAG TPA: LysR substrate-binding domain-containing protein [Chloroflexota bacterium]|nr:LysR substrate-binding domain-containing protein [Chloroflexota bacterium]